MTQRKQPSASGAGPLVPKWWKVPTKVSDVISVISGGWQPFVMSRKALWPLPTCYFPLTCTTAVFLAHHLQRSVLQRFAGGRLEKSEFVSTKKDEAENKKKIAALMHQHMSPAFLWRVHRLWRVF